MKIDAFILIGGKSSRLGTDKALVELGEKSLAERAVDVIRDGLAPERITMVAGNSLQFAVDAIVADIPFIFDLHEGRGPIGGLHAALAHAKSPWIFILACDYPFISSELIRLLAEKIDDDFGVIAPEQNYGRIQPLSAFYRVETARPVVEEIIERARPSPPMHEVVGELKPLLVSFEEYSHLAGAEKMFVNINTVDDLNRARSALRARDSSRFTRENKSAL